MNEQDKDLKNVGYIQESGEKRSPKQPAYNNGFIEELLIDVGSIEKEKSFSVPISELAILGTLLVPSDKVITTTIQLDTNGLYRIANSAPGDVLKMAKDGNAWGAMKTASGKSKFAKLKPADAISGTSTTIVPLDPLTLAMVAMIYSIDKKMDKIIEMEKKILDFLVNEKESQIEADLKILSDSLREYKHNWDNDLYVQGHYKQALDIKRTAEKNIKTYQRELKELKDLDGPIIANMNVDASVKSMLHKFKYYRMALCIYGMASFIELLMLKDFREEQLTKVERDLETQALSYRDYFARCSQKVEKAAKDGVERNVIKGVANAGKALGDFIGGIPFIKNGPVDEWLQDGGRILSNNANSMEIDGVKRMSTVSDPGLNLFTERISDIKRIYNHTAEICFDKDNIYMIFEDEE